MDEVPKSEEMLEKLQQACDNKDIDCLVNAAADLKLVVNQQDSDKKRLLHHTFLHNYTDQHLDIVTLLLQAGANPFLAWRDATPLEMACDGGHLDTIKVIIEAERLLKPAHCLHDRYGHVLFRTLCCKYTNVSEKGHLRTDEYGFGTWVVKPTEDYGTNASNTGRVNVDKYNLICKLLIENGASVDVLCESPGYCKSVKTSLHLSCEHADVEITRTLLDQRPNVDSLDDSGRTPLYYACGAADLECLLLLLDAGAAIDGIDRDNRNPLHFVHMPIRKKMSDNFRVTELLIRFGVDIYKLCGSTMKKTPFEHAMNFYSENNTWEELQEICCLPKFPLPEVGDLTTMFPVEDVTLGSLLKTIKAMSILFQAGLDDLQHFSRVCAAYDSVFAHLEQTTREPEIWRLIELASWIRPDQHVFSAAMGGGRIVREFGHVREVFEVSSLRKWSANVIRGVVSSRSGRRSLTPVLKTLDLCLPPAVMNIVLLEGPTQLVLEMK